MSMMELPTDVKIAVIGGSGLYELDGLTLLGQVNPSTPWGHPSDAITIATTPNGTKIAFLARHGRGHYLTPTEVPVRANIASLKRIGVEAILALSAVGSLREEIKPCDFVLPSEIIDRTKGIRDSTYFEHGLVAHVGFADPFDKELSNIVVAAAKTSIPDVKIHVDKTLICMEGPAFSTRAESHMYRSWGGDLINMSAIPEAKLAREAEIAYQMVCMSTDYDCWKEDEEAVTVEAVMKRMTTNSANAKKLLLAAIPILEEAINTSAIKSVSRLKGSMKFAVMTAPAKRSPEAVEKLNYILPGYY
ncbi:hypothetical protein SmJEL517_g05072 [Synchytrium microbalum]|uniref:S-methyl-5'-thioadenosine phosphorylase n=1 Tax=Synchytrium microbalum TaxID=1806994 RepID=A0A507BXS0_9FUNG|nr:uncharacterized protein SmJEL517_g05072 [Synchytrium microbalum]TPX31649.1 hypothetical protein SmJEL517_g05072 [Synchytrium microbalum]